MSSTKSQVAVATTIPTMSSQKDYSTEEHLGRQNSFGNNRRGNMKGKHLTRSHAMRESTSPPRTPTPRAEHSNSSTNSQTSNYQHHQADINENINSNGNNNKLHAQSGQQRGNSPIMEAPAVIITNQQQQNVALTNEAEFPKLSPPKSKGGNGGNTAGIQKNNNNNGNNTSSSSNSSCSNNSSNGTTEANNKMEYINNNSNSNNSNSNSNGNGKKLVVDLKSTTSNNGDESHKNNNNNNSGINCINNNNNKAHQQSYNNNSSNALQQALNVGNENATRNQQTSTAATCTSSTTTTIYNSGMNYQLNPTDVNNSATSQNQQQTNAYEKDNNRSPRNDSQNSNISNTHDDEQHYERGSGGGGGGNKKHRTNSNSKGTKPRLKNMGSSGSVEGNTNSNNTSGFISRVFNNSENSGDQFTDYGGTDLFSFFKETLNKNLKDRHILLKIEKDLIDFVQDKSRNEMRFPSASSYNRMLIHRTAAYFGLEHNVDADTQQCVIVATTKNTRIPEIRFKSLVSEIRNESRKSILKRDTHSFDEARQSSYLCPDRGVLDRKAKSFEEREEDYERARSRIFSRSTNDGEDGDDYMNMGWTSMADPQPNRNRPNGKMLKMHPPNDARGDGRSAGAVPKAHSFGGYGGLACNNNASVLRGDSINSNKVSGSGRVFSKQDSAGSANTPWRLSPSSSGSIYHFDPSNLPPGQTITTGYHAGGNSAGNYMPSPINVKKNKTHISQHQHHQTKNTSNNDVGASSVDDTSESSTQTLTYSAETATEPKVKTTTSATGKEEDQSGADECDNLQSGCLSITTSTSTKNYDRIEVQKFKNQATSPNIPTQKDEGQKRENSSASSESSNQCDQPTTTRQPQTISQSSTVITQAQNRETPHSSRSTPFSNSDLNAKRASEEPKATTWTYTQSYQAPDGSTVFHTTTTPNGSPYCGTTYQQGPDGSVYAIPQGMVYAYPPPVEGEVQGYFMPVFDPTQQRPESASIIPAAQAIYPAAGSTATMVPVAAAYTSQFAATNGAPIYPLYPSEQFAASGATVAAATPANGQIQQIPMATYPISGYPYAYNGYWGQTMTYYVPQQALANAVAATPILSAPPPPPPPPPATVPGAHVSNITAATPAGPSSNSTSMHNSGNGNSGGGSNIVATTSGNYHTHSGTTYFGTGRIKRPTPAHHYNGPQSSGHQLMATIPSAGGATATYQLGHAVPTLTLANPAATANDLSAPGAAPTATMYALPQHAALFPANVFPYTAAAGPAAVHPPHTATGTAATGTTHAQQSNAVITPIYAHPPPQLHAHGHVPGPAAIPIVDPVTLEHITGTVHVANNSNGGAASFTSSSNNSQSAPSTPHSLSSQHLQRNPPLFSTPPTAGTGNGNYSSTSSTPHYYTTVNSDQNSTVASNSQHNAYNSSYEKRTNNIVITGNKKPPSYISGNNVNRQNVTNSTTYSNGSTSNKPALIAINNDTRASPNNSSTGYQGTRPHLINKRGDKQQAPLLSGPPSYTGNTTSTTHHSMSSDATTGKPPIRLNAAAASFRHKSNNTIEYRRSVSQRNSPGTNSSSNENSNNNSPNSISAASTTPITNCFVPTYIGNNSNSTGVHAEQPQTTPTASLYIASRGTNHIPPTLPHGGTVVATTSGAATVLGGAMAHHQPLLSTYNPNAGSGMYVKYGQTIFAHPSVTLQNSRRSPSTDLRPPMAQMTGMYPTVNMMIPAPPRHAPSRHPNPNYKGTRPR